MELLSDKVATPHDWRDFGQAFDSFERRREIYAVYYPPGTQLADETDPNYDPMGTQLGVRVPGIPGAWAVDEPPVAPDVREDFQRLARKAAVAAGCPDHPDSWVYWLHAVRSGGAGLDSELDTVYGADLPIFRFRDIGRSSTRYCADLESGTKFPLMGASAETKGESTFPQPDPPPGKPCAWNEVEFKFLSEFLVQITVRGEPFEPVGYRQMGFGDSRTKTGPPKPRRAWTVFQILAAVGGKLDNSPKPLEKKLGRKEKFPDQWDGDDDENPDSDGADDRAADRAKIERRIFEIRNILSNPKGKFAEILQRRDYLLPTTDPIPCKGGTYETAFRVTKGDWEP